MMKQKICVQIMQEDIEGWSRDHCPHPLIGALRRSTQTQWRLVESNMAVEKAEPYRTLILHSKLHSQLLDCWHGNELLPYECEIELILPFFD